jgi:hypothetical protein
VPAPAIIVSHPHSIRNAHALWPICAYLICQFTNILDDSMYLFLV